MAAYVIVGASLAGATAAITLREEGADGTVTLIGAEQEAPYERPPLSKAYLRGDTPFDKALVRPIAFYADHDIQTIFGTRAIRIDPSERIVELEDSPTRTVRRSAHRHGRAKPAGVDSG